MGTARWGVWHRVSADWRSRQNHGTTLRGLRSTQLLALGAMLAACSTPVDEAAPHPQAIGSRIPAEGPVPLQAPDHSTIPEGPMGDAIRRGERLLNHTEVELPNNVGNGLRCTSCHLNGGTVANAGPWVGITAVFPQYRSRNARINTLEERVNDCFERSLNGTSLDPSGDDMAAILAHMAWLSQGVPMGRSIEGRGFARIDDPPAPDEAHGEVIYVERCAVCHGDNGEGRARADDGAYQFPPLWGDRSFNIGAGMARLDTAAAFVRWNMPLGQGGTLSEQDAYDVAAYFTRQPRPDFADKTNDWPQGGRPSDARY